ncbi:MAG: DUF928 domain-containing protein [Calothrix sp. MO_192.B10]|nr:DUF928 domain-containing protein [Calothrix sp. MO_192.B10]
MKKNLQFKLLTAICLVFCSTFFYSFPSSVTASETLQKGSKERKDDFPGRRTGGATRGKCSNTAGQLVALVPKNNLGLTKLARTQFLLNLSQVSQATDDNQNIVYEKAWKTNGSPGIINIDLTDSKSMPVLSVDGKYNWLFSMICEPTNRYKDFVVHGLVQRVNLSPALLQKLSQASPLERVSLYNQAGLWQDAVNTLAQELSNQPNNTQIAATWTKLLPSEKLDAIALFAAPLGIIAQNSLLNV